MPELPEVEVSRRGVAPHLENQQISHVIVRDHRLRWPVSPEIEELDGALISQVERRAKYLILHTSKGYVIVHLGMSGALRVVPAATPPLFTESSKSTPGARDSPERGEGKRAPAPDTMVHLP